MSEETQRRDRELMKRIVKKGPDGEAALAELDHHYRGMWIRVVRQRLGRCQSDAEDVVQRVLLQIWSKADQYDDKWAVSTWIGLMLRTRSLDAIRARMRKREISPDLDRDGAWPPDKSGGHLKVANPARGLEDTGEAADPKAMKLLKQHANGVTVPQLAWLYGTTEDAIHTRMRRARASIRSAAIEEGFDGRHGGLCHATPKRPTDGDDPEDE